MSHELDDYLRQKFLQHEADERLRESESQEIRKQATNYKEEQRKYEIENQNYLIFIKNQFTGLGFVERLRIVVQNLKKSGVDADYWGEYSYSTEHQGDAGLIGIRAMNVAGIDITSTVTVSPGYETILGEGSQVFRGEWKPEYKTGKDNFFSVAMYLVGDSQYESIHPPPIYFNLLPYSPRDLYLSDKDEWLIRYEERIGEEWVNTNLWERLKFPDHKRKVKYISTQGIRVGYYRQGETPFNELDPSYFKNLFERKLTDFVKHVT